MEGASGKRLHRSLSVKPEACNPVLSVPLPDTIPVRYTEEEAEYVSLRPVVRQTFRIAELVDMVVGVAGKNLERVQTILRAGTVVFHSYRYWWQGFEADGENLRELLAPYPDSEPSRPFWFGACVAVWFQSSDTPPRHSVEVRREVASRKLWFRSRSFWKCIEERGSELSPVYREYSYVLRADTYVADLHPALAEALADDLKRFGPRSLRAPLKILAQMSRIIFVCPREN